MGTEAVVREWGNSLGIIIPKEVVEDERIKKGDTIYVEIFKKANLREIFGSLKGKLTMTGQEAKDMAREGWG